MLQGDEAPAVFGGGKTKAEVVELVLNVAKDLDYFIYDDLEAALKTNEILRHMMWEQIEDARFGFVCVFIFLFYFFLRFFLRNFLGICVRKIAFLFLFVCLPKIAFFYIK